MTPLNEKSIAFLKRALKAAPRPCPLFAVEHKKIIIATNGTVLLQWPISLVDRDCAAYSKLLGAQKHKLAAHHVHELTLQGWSDYVFNLETGKLIKTEELDPTDEEVEAFEADKTMWETESPKTRGPEPVMSLVYAGEKGSRWNFHPSSFDIIEHFVPGAEFKMYLRKGDKILRPLAVFKDDILVGAFANDRPSLPSQEVQWPKTVGRSKL